MNDISKILFLYIDPGTGSMLFAVVMGIFATVVFAAQGLIIKVKQGVLGKKVKVDVNKLEYIIFTDHKRYWNVFKPICDEFERRKINISYWTMSQDDPALSEKYEYVKSEFIGEGNKGFAKLNMLNAKVCLATTPSIDVYQWKRSLKCDKYIHIFHGAHISVGVYKMFGTDYFDILFLTNELEKESSKKLEAQRNVKVKEKIVVGCPYLDEMKKRLESMGKTQKAEPMILISPSWGKSCLLNKYKGKIIEACINTGYKVCIRPHPQMLTSDKALLSELMDKYKENEKLRWNFDNDNFNILNESDIMISDFSGIMFDYSLVFGKPIIYANSEKDDSTYDAHFLDDKEKMNNEILPRLGKNISEDDFSNMKTLIDELLYNDEYKQKREELKEMLWEKQGESTNLIVDNMIRINKEIENK